MTLLPSRPVGTICRPSVQPLLPKADASSSMRTIQLFCCPLEEPLPPTSSPNITLCGRRSSPIRATNPANDVLRFLTVASMFSQAVLASVSAYESVVVALPFPPAEASQEYGEVNLSWPVVVRVVRAPRHAPVSILRF